MDNRTKKLTAVAGRILILLLSVLMVLAPAGGTLSYALNSSDNGTTEQGVDKTKEDQTQVSDSDKGNSGDRSPQDSDVSENENKDTDSDTPGSTAEENKSADENRSDSDNNASKDNSSNTQEDTQLLSSPLRAPANDNPYSIEDKGTYATLQEAVNAASDGDTIFVLSNCTEPNAIVEINKNVNIQAKNGARTITMNRDITIAEGVNVSLGTDGDDLTLNGTGSNAAEVDVHGTLVAGPNLTVNATSSYAIHADGGTVTINGGTYTGQNHGLHVRGAGNVISVKDAKFSAKDSYGSACYVEGDGAQIGSIDNSTFTCAGAQGHGLFISNGKVGSITNSTFTGGAQGETKGTYGILVYMKGQLDSVSNSTMTGTRCLMVWNGTTKVNNCTANAFDNPGQSSTGLQLEKYGNTNPNVIVNGGTYSGANYGAFNVGGTLSVLNATIKGNLGLWNYNENSTCPEIKNCDIDGVQDGIYNNGTIGTIKDGTIFGGDHSKSDGNSAIHNRGAIDTIEDVACTGDYSGLVNTSEGTITTIKGGSFKINDVVVSNSAEYEAAISNRGTITTIDGPKVVGRHNGIYNTGEIDIIKGSGNYTTFGHSNYAGAAVLYNGADDNRTGSIGTIEGGLFMGERGIKVMHNLGTVSEIKGGIFTDTIQNPDPDEDWASEVAVNNEGTIAKISGGEFTCFNQEIYNTEDGTIGEISGGTFKNNYADPAVYNEGTITTISGGEIENQQPYDGYMNAALRNDGSISTISGGAFKNATSGLYNYGSIDLISGGKYTSDTYGIINRDTIALVTGGTVTSKTTGLFNWGGTIETISVAEEGDLVVKGDNNVLHNNGKGSIGKVKGHGIYVGGDCTSLGKLIKASNIESTDNMNLNTTGDNPGYGRYKASIEVNDYADGTLPQGYHMSKMTTAVSGQTGDFHFLVKDGTVVYRGNGHALTDATKDKAAPGIDPESVFTTDTTAADNKTDFEFAAGADNVIFTGWNTAADGSGTAHKAGDALTVPDGEELILYAQWKNEYTITFDSDGGSAVEPIKVLHGDNVDNPPTPEKEGYTFDGWYTTSTSPEKFSFKNIRQNWALKAHWSKLENLNVTHYLDRQMNYQTNRLGIGQYEFMGAPDSRPGSSEFTTDYANYYNTYKEYTIKDIFDAQTASSIRDMERLSLEDSNLTIGAIVENGGEKYKLVKVTVNGTEVTSKEGLNTTKYYLKDKNDIRFYYEMEPIEIIIEGNSYEDVYDGESHEVSGFDGDVVKVWQYVAGQGTVGIETTKVKSASDGKGKYSFAAEGWNPSGAIRNVKAAAEEVLPADDSGYKTWEKDGDYYIVPEGKYNLYYANNKIMNFDPSCYVIKWKPGTMKVTPADLTITAKDQEYDYTGSDRGEKNSTYTDPEVIAKKISAITLLGSDAITSITLNGLETFADTYEGRISASGARIGTNGELSGNYTIKYENGKLTIQETNITYKSETTSLGTVTLDSEKVGKKDNVPAGSTAVPATGYHLVNWTDDNDSDKEVSRSAEFKPDNLPGSYTAHFAPNTDTPYVVKHLQQNVGNDEYTEVEADRENLTGTTDTEVTPEVKTYAGFTSPAKQTVKIKGDGTTVVEYKYTRNTVTATFDSNGGEDAQPASIEKKYGAELGTLPKTSRTGYTFDGWYTAKEGGDKINADTTMPAEDVKYYAHWKANNYTVKFEANTGSGEMEDESFTYDEEKNLTENAFTKAGYTFTGWNTAEDGSGTSYDDEETVKNLTSEDDGEVTLYAQWTANEDTKYTVEYFYQSEGKYPEEASSTVKREGTTDTDAEVTRADKTPTSEGYVFDESAGNVLEGNIEGDGSLVLRVFFKQQFKVEYKPGEHGTFKTQTTEGLDYGDDTPAAPETTGDIGYTFAGWLNDASQTVESIAQTVLQDLGYTATWKINQYDVTFDSNEGSDVPNQTVDHGSTANKPADPTRSGYTFSGWLLDGEPYDFSTPVTGPITLMAAWEEIPAEPDEPSAPVVTPDDDDIPAARPPRRPGRAPAAAPAAPAVAPAQPEVPEEITEEPVPQAEPEDIPEPETPQAEPEENTWALLNLIAAALTTVGAALALFRRKDDDESEDDEDADSRKRRFNIFKAGGAVAAAASIIAFILTEDMSNPMALADNWTILMAVLLAGQIGTAVGVKKNAESDTEDDSY